MGGACAASEDPATAPSAVTSEALSNSLPQVRARAFATTSDLNFGVAGDGHFVFVTQPLARKVLVIDRHDGHVLAEVPPPSGGFLLPFTLRVPRPGRLVIMDPGGFPSPTAPSIAKVYDYDYTGKGHGRNAFAATLARTVSFAGLPVVFAEDVETTADGTYIVSEPIIGALWVIASNGAITPGIFPASPSPSDTIAPLGPCIIPDATVGGLPFRTAGNFGPGVVMLASSRGQLYFSSTCRGGIQRIPLASLTDSTRPPFARAADIQVVSPRPAGEVETFEGLAFDPDDNDSPLYASDSFRLRIVRIDVNTGQREVIASDPTLFNFPTQMHFVPSASRRASTLMVASDQEHRFAAINAAISADMFQRPFVVTEVTIRR
jgi:hypothetical protein